MRIEYVAGFFDGEGCVSLQGQPHSVALIVVITNTHHEVLWQIQQIFGGRLRQRFQKPSQTYIWNLVWSHHKAKEILLAMQPYLIVKKPQADLALEFLASRKLPGRYIGVKGSGGKRIHPDARKSDLDYKFKMHSMNQKGPRPIQVIKE